MSPIAKKILLGLLVIILAGFVGFGLYYFFEASRPLTTTPTGQTTTQTTGGQLPSSGERPAATTSGAGVIPSGVLPTASNVPSQKPSYFQPEPVKKITEEITRNSSLNTSGAVRYRNPSDGKFYKILPNGTIKALSEQIFYNVKDVTWAKNSDKAVLEYPDGNKIIYNFEKQKQYSLPKHWEDFSFSPEGSQIAAKSIGLAQENRWLVTVNDDGTETKIIEALGTNADKVTVNWSPSRQTVAFSKTGEPLGLDRQEVLLVGLNHENFKGLTVEGQGFESSWSPTGQKLLYSVYSTRSNYLPELWVSDAYGDNIGSNRKSLKINTWSDKCAFADENTIYCAVPDELPTGAGMAPEIASGVTDKIYRIDLRTGFKTNIPTDKKYSIDTISYDQANKRLLFTDQFESGIFEVNT